MLIQVINFLILLLVIGLVVYLVIWVLGILGIAVPTKVVQIVGAIVFLLILLWFIQTVALGGGHVPHLLMLPLGGL